MDITMKKSVIFFMMFAVFCMHFGLVHAETGKDKGRTELSTSGDITGQGRYVSLEETHSDTELTETQARKTMEFSFSPQFQDALDRDEIRYRFRMKYGVTENLELRGTFVWLTGNPARKDEWDTELANASIGIKYKFKEWPNFAGIKSAVGFNYEFPMGSPPADLVDGYSRYRPYIVFSRFLDRNPRVQTFTNLSFNFVGDTPFREKPRKNRPKHSMKLTVGGSYYTSVMRYVCELSYKTNAIDGGSNNKVLFVPGVIWNIPKETTHFLPGLWQLSTGVEIPVTNEDENYRVFAKIKWDMDFLKKKNRSKKEDSASPD
jgi:hypothetical protein